jgi:outer membrane immunogenic protein
VSKSLKLEVALKLRTALLALAGVAASTAAIAADLPTRKEPMAPVPVVAPWSWTGFYLGGYVGGTFGSANWHDDGGTFGNGFGCGTILLPAACNFDGGGNSGTKAAFTGGGYVGYNYQFGQWVIGIEGEFGYLGIGNSGTTVSGSQIDTFGNLYPFSATANFNDHEIARVRGRLGYAVEPQLLLYVAGGWSWTETNASLSGFCCGTNGLLPLADPTTTPPTVPVGFIPSSFFSQSSNRGIDGWNIGVGAEYAFTPNWIARIEYIYDGFSNINEGFNFFPSSGSSSSAFFNDNRHVGLNVNTIRVGLEYKF